MIALIADDFDEMRALVSMTLAAEGIDVLEAADGREAIAIAEREFSAGRCIDVAVLDQMMPHYKGDAVAMKIRELAKEHGCCEPAMFMLTGSKDASLIARAQAAGLTELYIKPNGVTALRDRIVGRPAVKRAVGSV